MTYNQKDLKIVTNYLHDGDPDISYNDCLNNEYHSIEVHYNDIKLIEFGDSYHEKSREKCEGFILGLLFDNSDETTRRSIDDIEKEDRVIDFDNRVLYIKG